MKQSMRWRSTASANPHQVGAAYNSRDITGSERIFRHFLKTYSGRHDTINKILLLGNYFWPELHIIFRGLVSLQQLRQQLLPVLLLPLNLGPTCQNYFCCEVRKKQLSLM